MACVAWVDLLGYGAMLAKTRFDLRDPGANAAIARLRAFQRAAITDTRRSFPAMVINDGVAYFTDLDDAGADGTAAFLRRATQAHAAINQVDMSAGYPGARMVVAFGPRARIARPKRSDSHLRGLLDRLGRGVISPRLAVREAFIAGPVAGFVPALQANFAFTRAYLANEAGSKAGLGGAHCYIDLNAFDEACPRWIVFSRQQWWEDRGLRVNFGQLRTADWNAAARDHFVGLRSKTAVATALRLELA
jgi:hypothetical protein